MLPFYISYASQATHRGSREADAGRLPLQAAPEHARRRRRRRAALVPAGVDGGQLHPHRGVPAALQADQALPSGEW